MNNHTLTSRLARFGPLSLVLLLFTAGPAVSGDQDLRLVTAAAQQDWAAVRTLLGGRVDVNAARADGATALLWAAHWDNRDMVALLLKAGAKPDAADDHGVTPLARACENGSLAVVEALLGAGAKPDAAQTSGLTPLMIAAGAGSVPVVRALLTRGANVNAATTTGGTALMWAVAAPHRDVVKVLLEAGADVHVSSAKGFTPLLFTARNGDIETAKILLAAGARVNDTGSDGTHALPLAIINNRDKYALFLLEQGANPNGSMAGVSALHAAAGNVSTWLAGWFRAHGVRAIEGGGSLGASGLDMERRLGLVQTLLARGADPNARITTSGVVLGYLATPRRGAFEQNAVGTGDVRGATPLWVAGFSANGGGLFGEGESYQVDSSAEIMRALLAAGADHRITTDDGTTALMAAAGIGHRSYQPRQPRAGRSQSAEKAVAALVEAGADVNAKNEADYTALHAAAFRGWNEVVQYLVEHGAALDARDYRGRTPYRIAEGTKQSFQFQDWPETAALLRRLGANTRLGIPGIVHERADRELVANGPAAGGPAAKKP
jgi:ankyrin repeat protein